MLVLGFIYPLMTVSCHWCWCNE